MYRAPLFRAALPALLLAACSGQAGQNAQDVDIGNAAEAAQGSVDNYATPAQDTADAGSTNDGVGAPIAPTAPTPAPSPSATRPGPEDVVVETPFTPESAQGAANVVQTYYALLEAKRYRQAWQLWDQGGRASGMNATAFAASFARYREYHAEVFAPGRIDAGAGQRYVTVPVRVYGTLAQGNRDFSQNGTVTLHRAGDIDGATAAQRSWRISASTIKPQPGAAPSPTTPDIPARAQAAYRCTDGTRFEVNFDNRANTATIQFRPRGEPVELAGQRPASGIWYRGGGYELRGKGRAATLSRPGGVSLTCTAR